MRNRAFPPITTTIIRPYTSQDAFFALSAQGVDTRYSPTDNRVTSEIRAAVHAYTDVPTWDRAYVPAFHKLVSSIAVFVDNPRRVMLGA